MDLNFVNILIAIQLFHPSACSPNSLQNHIQELKNNAITSVELSSLKFGELPSLYFLYDTFTTKRFKSIYKDDPKKFEEFKKVHQYHGIKYKFHSLELRDVMLHENFNAEDLNLFSERINLTDAESMKYKFLEMNDHGALKFHNISMADFFVAQYFLDNIFHPKDTPSDDEMELRLRFFFHTIIYKTVRLPILNEFIMEMIEDQQGKMFSDQIRMIMKYRFRYLLDAFTSNELEFVEKISTIFKKDKEILENLWGMDQNQPYFLRFFKCRSSTYKVRELKALVEKFFKFEAAKDYLYNQDQNEIKIDVSLNLIDKNKIFRGKNQLLNILHLIHIHNDESFTKDILEITNYKIPKEILGKLEDTFNFYDFIDSENFTFDEKREFYFANAYDQISNAGSSENLIIFWQKIQNYFNKSELKEILIQKDNTFNQTHLFYLSSYKDEGLVNSFLNLTKIYLNKQEIKVFLNQRHPITGESFINKYLYEKEDAEIVRILWDFAKNYLSAEELKKLIFDNIGSSKVEDEGKFSFLLDFD